MKNRIKWSFFFLGFMAILFTILWLLKASLVVSALIVLPIVMAWMDYWASKYYNLYCEKVDKPIGWKKIDPNIDVVTGWIDMAELVNVFFDREPISTLHDKKEGEDDVYVKITIETIKEE